MDRIIYRILAESHALLDRRLDLRAVILTIPLIVLNVRTRLKLKVKSWLKSDFPIV